MKWLFSLLVLANIALLIWGVQRERVVPDVSMQESTSIGEMRLLSESRDTEVQPPEEGMSSQVADAPEIEEVPLASQEPEPVPMEQAAGTDTPGEVAVDPGQTVEERETELGEGSVESEQTTQVAEATPADEPMEASIATETPPEAISSGVSAEEGQLADSPESLVAVEEGIVEPVPTEEVPVQEAQYCGTVGPLEEETEANALLEALTERDIEAFLRNETVQKSAGFWVIIPPYATNQEARAEERRLASTGVKDYRRFYRGEYKNGISLGIYSRRRNADIRKAAIEAKGFSTEVVPRTKQITEFWLDYKAAPANKADNQDWLAENYPKWGVKDQSCSLIAMP